MNSLLASRQAALNLEREAQTTALAASQAKGSQLRSAIKEIQVKEAAAQQAAQTFSGGGTSGTTTRPSPAAVATGSAARAAGRSRRQSCSASPAARTCRTALAHPGYYQIIPGTWKLFSAVPARPRTRPRQLLEEPPAAAGASAMAAPIQLNLLKYRRHHLIDCRTICALVIARTSVILSNPRAVRAGRSLAAGAGVSPRLLTIEHYPYIPINDSRAQLPEERARNLDARQNRHHDGNHAAGGTRGPSETSCWRTRICCRSLTSHPAPPALAQTPVHLARIVSAARHSDRRTDRPDRAGAVRRRDRAAGTDARRRLPGVPRDSPRSLVAENLLGRA